MGDNLAKDMELREAAQALYLHRTRHGRDEATIPCDPKGPQSSVSDSMTDPASFFMTTTQEDIDAAQWLSSYRGDTQDHFIGDHGLGFKLVPEPPTSSNSKPSQLFNHGLNDLNLSMMGPTHTLLFDRSTYSSSPEEERRFFIDRFPFEPVDHDTRILLDYFETEFAQLISVAPRSSNNLLRVFMPMAEHNEGVRNAIASWSATHLRDIDDKFTAQSDSYMQLAIQALDNALVEEEDKDTTLAIALIILAIEVCKDGDSQWSRYLQIAHEIIKRRDLVHNYGGRDQIFLLKIFAYFDVMSSLPPDKAGPRQVETHIILSTIPNLGGPDCFMGICTPLYCLISETTAMAAKIHVEKWDQRRIATHASRMIVMIDNTEPKASELRELTRAQELPKHLAMFKILQLTAKLYINQTLLRYNPSSIGSQVLIQAVMPLFNNLGTVLVEMLFPLFIVGVDALCEDRAKVKRMLEIMHEKFRIGNVRCAYSVLEKCWESNLQGEIYVDWSALAYGTFGQCISFA